MDIDKYDLLFPALPEGQLWGGKDGTKIVCDHQFRPFAGYTQSTGKAEILACNNCPALKINQRLDTLTGPYPRIDQTFETIVAPWED